MGRPGRRRADVPPLEENAPPRELFQEERPNETTAFVPVDDATAELTPPVEEPEQESPAEKIEKPGFMARRGARREERLGRTSALRLTRISPWRATTIGLVYSVILAVVVESLVYFLWRALDAAGVFDKMISAVAPTGSDAAATLESWLTLEKFLTIGGVFAASLIVIVPMSIFFTAVVYNLTARLMGGIRLTFMGDKVRKNRRKA